MLFHPPRARCASAIFLCVAFLLMRSLATAAESTPGTGTIVGTIVDNESGLVLAGAHVSVVNSPLAAASDSGGGFVIANVPAGPLRLRIEREGYQPSDSDEIVLTAGTTVQVSLGIQRVASGGNLRTIGSSSVSSAQSLQRASTIYRTLSPETLLQSGTFRFGDALRTLPAINNSIPGDTAALGDDINLQIRGLGANETTATLDGHPIAYGVPGGYNYQLSPIFGIKNIAVTYGSAGTELTGVNAIGGIVDQQTISPTPDQRFALTQGWGSFSKMDSAIQATGTINRLGYAVAYGVGSTDGPFKDDYFYQPGAAYDPSATDPAVRALGVYKDDSLAVARSGLVKLRYDLSSATHVTVTSLASSYWEDKTGNGDGDYLTPTVALATGNQLLASKSTKDPCPAGEFTATNGNGTPWGTGPNGAPDGGSPCQTPQSYAGFIAGLQGAGPAWQSFNFNDEAIHIESDGARQNLRLDAYTNRYLNTGDRTFALPFVSTPGDVASWHNYNVSTTGAQLSDTFAGRNNQFSVGYQYDNYAYNISKNGELEGAPVVQETGPFLREAYHPEASPLAAYASLYLRHATETDSSYVDPRLALVYTAPGGRDVIRGAVGATTTEPAANLLDQQFTFSKEFAAGGGGGLNCGSANSIGSAPSSVLKPERGVDEEAAYGHRFSGDSQVELQLYNVNVYDYIASTITPLSTLGTGFLTPAQLATAEATLASVCGSTANPLALLGVSGSVNVNQLRSRGFMLGGRQRVTRGLFFDYDWNLTSTVLVSAPVQYLQQNLTAVPGSQVPRLPLHTLDFSADGQPLPKLDVRYTLHAIGDNNTKRLGGYNYSDLRIAGTVGPGTFAVTVSNLWNQNAFIYGYLGQGEPLPLNQYATKASYAPYIGAAATEEFGLPYRALFLTYTLQAK
jgi:hypothetical protein